MAGCTVPHPIFRDEARRRVKGGGLTLIHREALLALLDAVERALIADVEIPVQLREHFARAVGVLSHPSGGYR